MYHENIVSPVSREKKLEENESGASLFLGVADINMFMCFNLCAGALLASSFRKLLYLQKSMNLFSRSRTDKFFQFFLYGSALLKIATHILQSNTLLVCAQQLDFLGIASANSVFELCAHRMKQTRPK